MECFAGIIVAVTFEADPRMDEDDSSPTLSSSRPFEVPASFDRMVWINLVLFSGFTGPPRGSNLDPNPVNGDSASHDRFLVSGFGGIINVLIVLLVVFIIIARIQFSVGAPIKCTLTLRSEDE